MKTKLCLLLLLFTTPIFGQYKQSEYPQEILDRIKATAEITTSIVSDYSETKQMMAFNEPQISKGKFYFEADSKMRFQQLSPYPYIILINGESLRISDNGQEKHIPKRGNVAAKVNGFLLSLIQGDFSVTKNGSLTCFESSNTFKLVLVPGEKMLSKVYQEIVLYFDKESVRLEKIFFQETSGDTKTMFFSNQTYNSDILESIFNSL